MLTRLIIYLVSLGVFTVAPLRATEVVVFEAPKVYAQLVALLPHTKAVQLASKKCRSCNHGHAHSTLPVQQLLQARFVLHQNKSLLKLLPAEKQLFIDPKTPAKEVEELILNNKKQIEECR